LFIFNDIIVSLFCVRYTLFIFNDIIVSLFCVRYTLFIFNDIIVSLFCVRYTLFIFNDIIISLFWRYKHKDGLQEKSDKDLQQLKTVISNLKSDIVEYKQTNATLSNRLEILREEKLELEERMRLINMNFTFNK
jgi:hypothetical protein